jgi:hypothetical protein
MIVPTWTPGEVIPDGKYDKEPPNPRQDGVQVRSIDLFLSIGLPIIVVFLFVALMGAFCCCPALCCCISKKAQGSAQGSAQEPAADLSAPTVESVEK